MNELALFVGGGGSLLAGKLVGWRPICAVELDPYCRSILLARQRDGWLPRFPIWDDVRTFDGKPWRGHVDVITAGFPCQPWSIAGPRTGEGDERNLWPDTIRVVCEVRPRYVFLENTPRFLVLDYLGHIFGSLVEAGYDMRWCVLGADDVGAPHRRKRLWILATDTYRRELREQPGRRSRQGGEDQGEFGIYGTTYALADADRQRLEVGQGVRVNPCAQQSPPERGSGTSAMGDPNRPWQHELQRMQSDLWRRFADTSWWAVEP